MDSPSTVLSANEDKHPALSYSIPEGGEKKEEVEDNPWSIDPFKPKKKGKSMSVNWDDYGDYEEEDEDEEEKEEEKIAVPAPAPVEEKKDADFDFSFDNTTTNQKAKKGIEEPDSPADAVPSDENWSIGVSKQDKKKKKSTFSWGDEPEEPAPEPVEPLEEKAKRAEEDFFWDTIFAKKKDKKGENAAEEKEPDQPVVPDPEEMKDDDDWATFGRKGKKKKKKKSTISWGDESIDSERQPPVIKAEDEDKSENAPPATNHTRRPLQEVESPMPEEETTGPPARRQSL
ncbi:hypothetical protein KJ359_012490 [Pestalotiopsis sp. 9143b]|nr:hypothetical protein KJ359_012490 [Pestalotiopsis sp. 9143b]